MPIGTIEDLIACDKEGVKDFTVDGQCSNCGQCCSDVLPVSDRDIRRIRDYIVRRKIRDHGNKVLRNAIDLTCPFRDNIHKRCAIYPVRPGICREFQCNFSPERLADNKAYFHRHYRAISMRETFYGGKDNGRQNKDRLVRCLMEPGKRLP